MDKDQILELIQQKNKLIPPISEEKIERLAKELSFFLQHRGMIFSLQRLLAINKKFSGNKPNSYLLYLLDIVTNEPDFNRDFVFKKGWYPTRYSSPDIDMDFENNRKVQEYAEEKYKERFIYISTFNQWGIKAAIQNASKYNNFKLPGETIASTAIILSKAISKFDKDFEEAINNDFFRELRSKFPEVEKVINDAKLIYNQKNSIGKHAGGVIICDVPVYEICPYFVVEEVINQKKTGRYIRVSQFNDKDCELLGLVKADFLGVKTLESLHVAVNLIKSRRGINFDIESIDVFNEEENKKILKLFHYGLTCGIFQFEGYGITKFLMELKPTCFNDLVAANALFRPGPKDNGYTEEYCRRKNNPHLAKPPCEALTEILKDTYGLWVYQEQVMKGAEILAGFTTTEADELRRIIGKKDVKKIPAMKEKFINSCVKVGKINKEMAIQIWEQFEKFASYAFNRSHAASYTKIAYQTAYIKANFTIEFFASIMTRELKNFSSSDEKSNLKKYEEEAKKFNINILPPDINKSKSFYTIETIDNVEYIRCPLSYIEGIGEEVEKEIILKQPYESFEDFYMKHDTKLLNSRVINTLIDSGILSHWGTKEELLEKYNVLKHTKENKNKNKNNSIRRLVPKMDGLL